MSHSLIVESLRLLLAAYLLVIACAAVGGWHRPLLSYPLHATYAAVRLIVAVLTVGQVRMAPITRRAKATGRKQRDRRRVNHEAASPDALTLDSDAVTWQAAHPTAPSADPTLIPDFEENDDVPPPPKLW